MDDDSSQFQGSVDDGRPLEEVDPTPDPFASQVPCACQKRFADSLPFVLAVAVLVWAGERALTWWRRRRRRRRST